MHSKSVSSKDFYFKIQMQWSGNSVSQAYVCSVCLWWIGVGQIKSLHHGAILYDMMYVCVCVCVSVCVLTPFLDKLLSISWKSTQTKLLRSSLSLSTAWVILGHPSNMLTPAVSWALLWHVYSLCKDKCEAFCLNDPGIQRNQMEVPVCIYVCMYVWQQALTWQWESLGRWTTFSPGTDMRSVSATLPWHYHYLELVLFLHALWSDLSWWS